MNSEQLCDLVVDALEEVKAKDIVKLDVRELTTVTDYMIVASGTSNRHVKALADAVAEKGSAGYPGARDVAARPGVLQPGKIVAA
jgi:ribosome-associated protein